LNTLQGHVSSKPGPSYKGTDCNRTRLNISPTDSHFQSQIRRAPRQLPPRFQPTYTRPYLVLA
jgi:hypothetical protein